MINHHTQELDKIKEEMKNVQLERKVNKKSDQKNLRKESRMIIKTRAIREIKNRKNKVNKVKKQRNLTTHKRKVVPIKNLNPKESGLMRKKLHLKKESKREKLKKHNG
jgi:hypothetical protein